MKPCPRHRDRWFSKPESCNFQPTCAKRKRGREGGRKKKSEWRTAIYEQSTLSVKRSSERCNRSLYWGNNPSGRSTLRVHQRESTPSAVVPRAADSCKKWQPPAYLSSTVSFFLNPYFLKGARVGKYLFSQQCTLGTTSFAKFPTTEEKSLTKRQTLCSLFFLRFFLKPWTVQLTEQCFRFFFWKLMQMGVCNFQLLAGCKSKLTWREQMRCLWRWKA